MLIDDEGIEVCEYNISEVVVRRNSLASALTEDEASIAGMKDSCFEPQGELLGVRPGVDLLTDIIWQEPTG